MRQTDRLSAVLRACHLRDNLCRNVTSGTDKKVMSLVEYQNEAVKQENSNKNPEII